MLLRYYASALQKTVQPTAPGGQEGPVGAAGLFDARRIQFGLTCLTLNVVAAPR